MPKGFLDPQIILKKLKLKSDLTAVDFGSGAGGWAIPLAEQLEDGKVVAIDILEEPLSALKAEMKRRNLKNIKIVKSDIESQDGSEMESESCDLVLMTNLLFQTEDKEAVLKEAKRILKKRGRILIVDWLPNLSFGPQKGVEAKNIKRLAEKLSLKIKKEFEASSHHWAMILEKKSLSE